MTMATATEVPTSGKPPAEKAGTSGRPPRRRGGRRSRSQPAVGVRYFVGRHGEPGGKPTLEQEVASEPEALVIAFKSDKRVYFVSEYGVTERIEGDQVRLEKEPASGTSSSQKGFLPPTKVE